MPHGPSGSRGRACSCRGTASAGMSTVPSACASEQPLSVLRRINSSTKWAVSTAAAVFLLLWHDSATLWCLAGSVASTVLCKVPVVTTARSAALLSTAYVVCLQGVSRAWYVRAVASAIACV